MLRAFGYLKKEECAEIFCELYRSKPFEYDWVTKEGTLEYFDDLMRTPKFLGFTYEVGKKIMAVCLGIKNEYYSLKKYKIIELYVRREYIGMGFGTKILDEVEQELNFAGIKVIELDTSKNHKCIDFYKKNRFNISEDNIHMVKFL